MANFPGTVGNDTYAGTADPDTISDGGGGSDNLSGAGGADVITLTGGDDTANGGDGADRLVVNLTSAVSSISTGSFSGDLAGGYTGFYDGAGSNNVTFSGIEHFSITFAGAGSAILRTGDGNDSLVGGAAADTLNSGNGADTINGGDGIDVWSANYATRGGGLNIDLGAVSNLYGGGRVRNMEAFGTFVGGTGADTITSTALANTAENVSGGDGDDIITLFGKNDDTVAGGQGFDTMSIVYGSTVGSIGTGSFSGDLAGGYTGFYDGAGADNVTFSTVERFSLVYGGAGTVVFTTGDGDDTLTGGGLNDNLRSGGGIDVIDGGGGLDVWSANLGVLTAGATIDLGVASSFGGVGSVVNVESFENLTGSGFADTLTSTALANTAEYVAGGAGDDVISLFGKNSDTVDGGADTDLMSITYGSSVGGIGTGSFSGDLAGGYTGFYDGAGADDLSFFGIERFALVYGGAGTVTFQTGDGNDTLTGGGLNDTLRSGGGVDVVDGGAGVDVWSADLSVLTSGATIDLGTASSFGAGGSVVNMEGFGVFTGSGFDDTIISTNLAVFAEQVNGGDGDDFIRLFGKGDDTVAGGEDFDTLSVLFGANVGSTGISSFSGALAGGGYTGFYDGPGADNVTFSTIERFELIYGGVGTVSFQTGDGDDTLTGGALNDTLRSGGGVDVIDGGDGLDNWGADLSTASDDIVIDLNGDSSFLGSGSVVNVEAFNTLLTGSGDDQIANTGAINAESVGAGGGADVITWFHKGDDTVDAGSEDDLLVLTITQTVGSIGISSFSGDAASGYTGFYDGAGSDNFTFFGVERFDIAYAGAGTSTLRGGDNDDTLAGGAQGDNLNGFGGDDVLRGGVGNDTIAGGAGTDLLMADFSTATTGIVSVLANGVDGASGTYGNTAAFKIAFTGIEAFSVTGGSGADSLLTGGGDDTVVGGLGDDTLDGGAGLDAVSYAAAAAKVKASLALSGVQNTGEGRDTLLNFERLIGSDFADNLQGTASADTLTGGSGTDTLNGGLGDDRLEGGEGGDTANYLRASSGVAVSLALDGLAQETGGAGVDTLSSIEHLRGSKNNDSLTGNAGSNILRGDRGEDVIAGDAGKDDLFGDLGGDTLTGGAGGDDLSGGRGADRFIYNSVGDSGVGANARDRIRDFSEAEGDRINLKAIDAKVSTSKDNDFSIVSVFSGQEGELTLEFDGARTIVRGDVNGDGVADFSIEVVSAVALTADAFIL